MHVDGRRQPAARLWFAATGLVLLLEMQLICHRTSPVSLAASSETRSTRTCGRVVGRVPRCSEGLRLGDTGQTHTAAILVIGCAGTIPDDEFKVTLRIERADARQPIDNDSHGTVNTRATAADDFCSWQDRGPNTRRLASSSGVSEKRVARPTTPPLQVARRVFFLHSPGGALDDPANYSALHCRLVGESDSIRVLADQTVSDGEPLETLAAELTQLADEIIGPAVRELIGSVRDVDGDRKLAVVLTSQLGQADGPLENVDGLTRACDFRHQVPRPMGNEADVIFLNANLPRGERLRAVLAHEWAHAAIFGRRYGESGGDSEQRPTEDDWLNEALAHLVEVRASGSSSNVSHRIQAFLDRPEAAPLVVRDYYRPDLWRHHGCRGATFLFLDWCLIQSGPQLFDRLIDGDGVGVEHLERATNQSFETLFRGWTTSLGENLAESATTGAEADLGAEALCQPGRSIRPRFHEWKPGQPQTQQMTLQLRRTTAAYVKVTLDDAAVNWHLFADAPSECRLQLTVIPIVRAR